MWGLGIEVAGWKNEETKDENIKEWKKPLTKKEAVKHETREDGMK